MGPVKVHGNVFFTATQRVLATLYEKEIDFEFVSVDLTTAQHKKEPFLSLSPFGLLPAYEDGDLKMFESRAITQHIAHTQKTKGPNLVIDGPQMAIISIWMEVEAHQFEPVTSKLNWELVFKPFFKMQTDESIVEENKVKLGKILDVYEKRLTEFKYLGGDEFSLADLHHLPNIQCLLTTDCKRLFEERTRVSEWVIDITSRPAWSSVVAMMPKV